MNNISNNNLGNNPLRRLFLQEIDKDNNYIYQSWRESAKENPKSERFYFYDPPMHFDDDERSVVVDFYDKEAEMYTSYYNGHEYHIVVHNSLGGLSENVTWDLSYHRDNEFKKPGIYTWVNRAIVLNINITHFKDKIFKYNKKESIIVPLTKDDGSTDLFRINEVKNFITNTLTKESIDKYFSHLQDDRYLDIREAINFTGDMLKNILEAFKRDIELIK